MLFSISTAAAPSTNRPDRIGVATQWQLMWWRFRKHRLAMLGGHSDNPNLSRCPIC
ncbi:hypothetical protein KFU94_43615 [Chloroflexi bacterium TSY]|nr:hypothetical protein [Chloroflexi bacterium TSY]